MSAQVEQLPARGPEPEQQQPEQQQPENSSTNSSSSGHAQRSWKQRLIRYGVAAIQCVLLLELAAMGIRPLLPQPAEPEAAAAGRGSDSDKGVDPADILMDVFTGRRGISALRVLTNKQLREGVDALVTEDYVELGMKDRGAELREVVDEIIKVRERGPPKRQPGDDRVGLGKLGPLRFRNKPHKADPAGDSATAGAAAARDAAATAADAEGNETATS